MAVVIPKTVNVIVDRNQITYDIEGYASVKVPVYLADAFYAVERVRKLAEQSSFKCDDGYVCIRASDVLEALDGEQ